LDFFADLDLALGARTGFAEHGREFAVVAICDGTGTAGCCENEAVGKQQSAARRSGEAENGMLELERPLIILRLLEEMSFAAIELWVVRNLQPAELSGSHTGDGCV
jgi:hypothetical protein